MDSVGDAIEESVSGVSDTTMSDASWVSNSLNVEFLRSQAD